MQTLSVQIKQAKAPIIEGHISRVSAPKIQGVKTIGFLNLISKRKGAISNKKGVKVFKTLSGLKRSKLALKLKASLKYAIDFKQAFCASLKALTLENMIKHAKQAMKYGYSFAKSCNVSRAILRLRQFKNSLSLSVRAMAFNA